MSGLGRGLGLLPSLFLCALWAGGEPGAGGIGGKNAVEFPFHGGVVFSREGAKRWSVMTGFKAKSIFLEFLMQMVESKALYVLLDICIY